MRNLLSAIFCRLGYHRPVFRGYDVGFLLECKHCNTVLHSKFYDQAPDEETVIDCKP